MDINMSAISTMSKSPPPRPSRTTYISEGGTCNTSNKARESNKKSSLYCGVSQRPLGWKQGWNSTSRYPKIGCTAKDMKVKKWDGAARMSTDWDGLRRVSIISISQELYTN
jgi:hypothetical protein